MSSSSMPSKYSANRNFLLNAFKSSVSSCSFPNFGTGVNLSPLVSKEISGSESFLFDKLIILMSVLFSSIVAGVCAHGLWFSPGPGLVPGLVLKK